LGKKSRDEVERPRNDDVYYERVVLVERVAVGPVACSHHHVVDDPGLATRPGILLELMDQENREIGQQNDLNCVQVTQESARNGYDPERETETIPVSTNELHTIYAYRPSLSVILRLAVAAHKQPGPQLAFL
jgi:hypothetical protein